MDTLDALLAGIVAEPLEETRWLVLADWLEEHDDPRRAELLRLHRKLLATCCEPGAHPERANWQARMVELLEAGVHPCVPQRRVSLPGGGAMTFSFVPPGSFRMGTDRADAIGVGRAEPARRVTLTRGFYIGVYPVTQAQWRAVTGVNPSQFVGDDRPVENVMRDGCLEFCQVLTAHLDGLVTVRLPWEAEWECACRAGTTTDYHFGDVPSETRASYDASQTWNGSPKGEKRSTTTVVGSFPPNPWGLYDMHGNVLERCEDRYELYDMHGNVLEWCEDRYVEHGADEEDGEGWIDPFRASATDLDQHVLRGGCYWWQPIGCCSWCREWDWPNRSGSSSGCRVCFYPEEHPL